MESDETCGTFESPRHGYMLGVSACMQYLHHGMQTALIHRDLKPDNIMISGRNKSKVADFGESRRLDERSASVGENDAITMTCVGTPL